MKCKCNVCDQKLEFDDSCVGQTINCPICGNDTILYAPPVPPIITPKRNSWFKYIVIAICGISFLGLVSITELKNVSSKEKEYKERTEQAKNAIISRGEEILKNPTFFNIKVEVDTFDNTTTFQTEDSSIYKESEIEFQSDMWLQVQSKNGKNIPVLTWYIAYTGDDWINMDHVSFKLDGEDPIDLYGRKNRSLFKTGTCYETLSWQISPKYFPYFQYLKSPNIKPEEYNDITGIFFLDSMDRSTNITTRINLSTFIFPKKTLNNMSNIRDLYFYFDQKLKETSNK